MKGGTSTTRLDAFAIASSIPSIRGTYLGVDVHSQGHRAVVYLGDGGAGLQLWSLDPPGMMDVVELQAQSADEPWDLPERFRPWAWRHNEGASPAGLLPVNGVAASRTGDVLVVAAGRQVRTLRLSEDDARLEPRITLPPLDAAVAHIALSRGAEQIFCADANGELQILSALDGREIHRLGLTPKPRVLRFIWGDKLVLVGDELGRVTCWNAKSGARHLQFQAHHGAVLSATFDTSRRHLMTTGQDGTARLWSLEEGVQVGGDMVFDSPVLDGVFCRQGQIVLCVTEDGWLHACHSGTGAYLDQFRPPGGAWGLSVADARGLAVLVGARGLHVLQTDWARLLDARGQSVVARRTEDSMVSSADTPPAVPVTHEKRLGDAPIGAVMPHHDLSQEIRINPQDIRGREGSQLIAPDASRIRQPGRVPGDTGDFFELPADEEPRRPAPRPQDESRVRHVFRRPGETQGEAVAIELAEDVTAGGAPAEPAERADAGSAPAATAAVRRAAMSEVGEPARRAPARYGAERSSGGGIVPLVLAAVGLAVALGLTAATGGPGSDAAEELAVIAAERDQAVAEARASLEEFASAQERRLDEFRAGTTIRSEIDRMQRQVTASVRQAERQFEERSEVAEETYRARAEMLEASVSTQVMVGYAWRGLVGFILGGLAGLFFARARRDD